MFSTNSRDFKQLSEISRCLNAVRLQLHGNIRSSLLDRFSTAMDFIFCNASRSILFNLCPLKLQQHITAIGSQVLIAKQLIYTIIYASGSTSDNKHAHGRIQTSQQVILFALTLTWETIIKDCLQLTWNQVTNQQFWLPCSYLIHRELINCGYITVHSLCFREKLDPAKMYAKDCNIQIWNQVENQLNVQTFIYKYLERVPSL